MCAAGGQDTTSNIQPFEGAPNIIPSRSKLLKTHVARDMKEIRVATLEDDEAKRCHADEYTWGKAIQELTLRR